MCIENDKVNAVKRLYFGNMDERRIRVFCIIKFEIILNIKSLKIVNV